LGWGFHKPLSVNVINCRIWFLISVKKSYTVKGLKVLSIAINLVKVMSFARYFIKGCGAEFFLATRTSLDSAPSHSIVGKGTQCSFKNLSLYFNSPEKRRNALRCCKVEHGIVAVPKSAKVFSYTVMR
jgi:hypothetical protein